MRQPRHHLSSEYIHITQRGLGRRVVFEDEQDKRRYLATLKSKLEDSGATVLAWALMENHVHLLVKALPADLSRLMQRTGVSYAQYFNGRHGHVGKVFQNRFSSEPIEGDAHLLATIRYIHRNPKEAAVAEMEDYPWSSYREVSGETSRIEGAGICDTEAVLNMFGSLAEFKRFHNNWSERDGYAETDGYRPRLSDEDAREIAIRHYGVGFADRIATMPKHERDAALKLLKDLGISVRQLERLTGIGRGVVARA